MWPTVTEPLTPFDFPVFHTSIPDFRPAASSSIQTELGIETGRTLRNYHGRAFTGLPSTRTDPQCPTPELVHAGWTNPAKLGFGDMHKCVRFMFLYISSPNLVRVIAAPGSARESINKMDHVMVDNKRHYNSRIVLIICGISWAAIGYSYAGSVIATTLGQLALFSSCAIAC